MAKDKQTFTECSKNWNNNILIRENNYISKMNFWISGQKIETKKQTKYLQIIIDEHLSLKKDFKPFKQKITKVTGLLAKLRHT